MVVQPVGVEERTIYPSEEWGVRLEQSITYVGSVSGVGLGRPSLTA